MVPFFAGITFVRWVLRVGKRNLAVVVHDHKKNRGRSFFFLSFFVRNFGSKLTKINGKNVKCTLSKKTHFFRKRSLRLSYSHEEQPANFIFQLTHRATVEEGGILGFGLEPARNILFNKTNIAPVIRVSL